uniref:MFS_1_like domain-containing protein n=1 Tax=Heterorhabditis bacteriophora TaxID=37862 RepID=A0A1I7WV72_HETBA
MSNVPKSPLFHPCSRRLHLLFLCMFGLFNSTYMNANLAITITCMINSTAIALNQEAENPVTSNFVSNATNGSLLEDIEFSTVSNLHHCRLNNNGTRKILDYGNYLFSASFKGAIVAIIPSIYLVQRTSPKLLLMLCIANKAMMNAVIPYLAVNYGYNAVFGARFVLGLGDVCFRCYKTILSIRYNFIWNFIASTIV